MNIYAYYRVSTQSQVEQNGIEMQVAEVEKYCKENDITLAGEFKDEGISGTKFDRDGLAELLSVLQDGDKILVQNTSRLWRDQIVAALVQIELKKKDTDIISIEQPTFSVYDDDPNNFLINMLMQGLDQWERMSIKSKLAKGRKARAKTGNKPCGTAPYGYKWNGNKIEIDYNNHLIVKDIFRMCVDYKGNLSKIARKCTEKGYKTARGNNFSVQAIKNILTNDFYVGVVTYAGKKVDGEHKPIIEKALFENVNEILGGGKQ